jgi:hypothetical protein
MQEEYTRPQIRPLARCMVLAAVTCASACTGSSPRPASAGQDATTQIADGGIAPADHRDASAARGPSSGRGSPAPGLLGLVPTRGRGTARIVPSGTKLTLVSEARVCTNTYHPGDTFTATVTDSAPGGDGAVVPAGSLADFEVTEITPAPDRSHARRISIALDSLAIDGVRYPASAHITSIVTRKVRSAAAVGATPASPIDPDVAIGTDAETGDILGVILSHSDRSTVIGARPATGDLGADAAPDFCIPRNGRITLTLTVGERLQ